MANRARISAAVVPEARPATRRMAGSRFPVSTLAALEEPVPRNHMSAAFGPGAGAVGGGYSSDEFDVESLEEEILEDGEKLVAPSPPARGAARAGFE